MKKPRKRPLQQADQEALNVQSKLKLELRSLAVPKDEDSSRICVVDNLVWVKKLRTAVGTASKSLDLPSVDKLHGLILKNLTKPPKKFSAIRLTDATADLASKLLGDSFDFLTARLAHRVDGGNGTLESLAKRLISTIVELCDRADGYGVWVTALDCSRQISRGTQLTWEELLSEDQVGPTYRKLKERVLTSFEAALQTGDERTVTRLVDSCRGHSELTEAIDSRATALKERVATLPVPSQEWMFRHLRLSSTSQSLDYSNPADSPDIRQAATLLLLLLDQSHLGESAVEPYERFKSLCERHFRLFMRGQVGQVVPFEPRLHETVGPRTENVRLVRPWVEWFDPPQAKVVVRAIAEHEN